MDPICQHRKTRTKNSLGHTRTTHNKIHPRLQQQKIKHEVEPKMDKKILIADPVRLLGTTFLLLYYLLYLTMYAYNIVPRDIFQTIMLSLSIPFASLTVLKNIRQAVPILPKKQDEN